MSSGVRHRFSGISVDATPFARERKLSFIGVPYGTALVAVVLATFLGCAHCFAGTASLGSFPPNRHPSLEQAEKAPFLAGRNMAIGKHRASSTNPRHAADAQNAVYGLASFYGHKPTARGEEAAEDELTAAHRTLPFGTMVRVTNVATGQSVMVRINDRGPFVRGRIVDVSYSAAETLGIIETGIAKIKLDVVE